MKSGEIINKIEDAGLVTLDLQDFIKPGRRAELDLAEWLENGLIIKEASFKNKLKLSFPFDLIKSSGSSPSGIIEKNILFSSVINGKSFSAILIAAF